MIVAVVLIMIIYGKILKMWNIIIRFVSFFAVS